MNVTRRNTVIFLFSIKNRRAAALNWFYVNIVQPCHPSHSFYLAIIRLPKKVERASFFPCGFSIFCTNDRRCAREESRGLRYVVRKFVLRKKTLNVSLCALMYLLRHVLYINLLAYEKKIQFLVIMKDTIRDETRISMVNEMHK